MARVPCFLQGENAMITTGRQRRPLRLTLITETFPPEVNGVARTLGLWDKTFRSLGHQIQLIRPRQPGEKATADRVHGLPLPYYPQMRFGIASPLRMMALLEKTRPDLVHIATEGPLGWAALMAATSLGVPVASSFHTNFDHYLGYYGLGLFEGLLFSYLRWFHNQTAVTLVPSQSTRRRLLNNGIQRVEIWSRGVDAEAFHPRHRDESLRRSLGLEPEDVLLVYVGRLASEKNLPALVQAFGQLQRRVDSSERRVRLALIGAGPLAASFQALQMPGLILAGEQHGQSLARWYASADIFAFPSCSETFGNSVLEAQASGLPVVAFDCQVINERVSHGTDGFLTPLQGNLSESLERLVRRPDLRACFALEARAKAERQSWKAVFDGLEKRYYDLVDGERLRQQAQMEPARLPDLAWPVSVPSGISVLSR